MLNTSRKFNISLLIIWQLFSVLLVAVFGWPGWLLWVNVALLVIFMAIRPLDEGIYALVASLPALAIIPNDYFDTLAAWRPLVVWLFAVWLIRDNRLSIKKIVILPWDKYLYALGALMLVSGAWATFWMPALMQFLFFFNIFLFYFVIVQTIQTKEQALALFRYAAVSLTVFIAVGFAQLAYTFFVPLDTFWVFWATTFTQAYYGLHFASVSLYSNSWFSFIGGRQLRMFGIMPDSQSFAYLCVYAIGIGAALAVEASSALRRFIWAGIRFACLALILSGTRAVWVGMLAPFLALTVSYARHFMRQAVNTFFWPLLIVVALFAISPFINKAMAFVRAGGMFEENFLSRAQSIYDLKETSNAGRLLIWKESARYAMTHPFGTGAANFLVSAATPEALANVKYELLAEQKNLRYNLPQKYVTAHNLYLHITVELGWLGLVLFGLFWLSIAREFWKYISANRKENTIWLFLVLQAGLVFLWLAAAAFFDVTWYNDKALMFFFVELAASGAILRNVKAEGIIGNESTGLFVPKSGSS